MNNKKLNIDAPTNTKKTVLRLCSYLKPQSLRLSIVGISIILYTILSI